MWWMIPFGLFLGLGAVAALVWGTEILQAVPREVVAVVMPFMFLLSLMARAVISSIGRRLRAYPRDERTRLHLNA